MTMDGRRRTDGRRTVRYDTSSLEPLAHVSENTQEQDKSSDSEQEPPFGDCKTRAPRGTDRSPEYNEHFCCIKLDSRVKILTTEWNEKQQHFITHASRSLL